MYVWADGIHFNIRLEDDRQCILVVMGATPEGKKELLASRRASREREIVAGAAARSQVAVWRSSPSWPSPTALWVSGRRSPRCGRTREQRCWVHKTANVLNKANADYRVAGGCGLCCRYSSANGGPCERPGLSAGFVKTVYGPDDWTGDPARDLGRPGEYPFTRGPYPTMYTSRLWTMRQYAGFGTAQETNRRFRQLLAAGQMGLSTAFDLPTQMGYDSDHPMAQGEVGRVGVAIDTVDDLKALFQEIPLDRVSTSMTINATAAILLAMYVVTGEEQGLAPTQLTGTVQNDVLKEYMARGTYIYPAGPSLRLVADIVRFITDQGMSFNPISISGYHMREAGATAVQEVGFTLANALEYVRVCSGCRPRGRQLRAPSLVLFCQSQRSVRGGSQISRGAPAVGPFDAGAIRCR